MQKGKLKSQTTEQEVESQQDTTQKDKQMTQTTNMEVGLLVSELPETVAPTEIVSVKNWKTLTF